MLIKQFASELVEVFFYFYHELVEVE